MHINIYIYIHVHFGRSVGIVYMCHEPSVRYTGAYVIYKRSIWYGYRVPDSHVGRLLRNGGSFWYLPSVAKMLLTPQYSMETLNVFQQQSV